MSILSEIPLIITIGDAYYGNGEADCFTCWSAGKVLAERGGGNFSVDALEQSQVDFLLQMANEHLQAHPSHKVRVYEFRRGVGESTQTTA